MLFDSHAVEHEARIQMSKRVKCNALHLQQVGPVTSFRHAFSARSILTYLQTRTSSLLPRVLELLEIKHPLPGGIHQSRSLGPDGVLTEAELCFA